jgi:PAS domain S-box-containing protein
VSVIVGGRLNGPGGPADAPKVGSIRTRDPEAENVVHAARSRADEAEAKYRSLVDLLPAITYVEDLGTGRTFSISPQVEPMLGYTPEEWLGEAERWADRLHPDDRDRVIDACARANADHAPWRAEYRMIAKDGRTVWIHDRAELVLGSDGRPLCWQGVMVDITAQRREN